MPFLDAMQACFRGERVESLFFLVPFGLFCAVPDVGGGVGLRTPSRLDAEDTLWRRMLWMIAASVLGCAKQAPPPTSATATDWVPMPALVRAEVAPSLALPVGSPVTWLGPAPDGGARIRTSEAELVVPAAALAPLPFMGSLRVAVEDRPVGSAELVVGSSAAGLELDLSGPFAPVPQPVVVSVVDVDLGPATDATLLGDLPGDAWTDPMVEAPGGRVCLTRAAKVRGVEVPTDATLRWEPPGVLISATLASDAEIAGLFLPTGTVLFFGQGCDVAVTVPGKQPPRCMLLQEGWLVDP